MSTGEGSPARKQPDRLEILSDVAEGLLSQRSNHSFIQVLSDFLSNQFVGRGPDVL